jgi:ferredoxin
VPAQSPAGATATCDQAEATPAILDAAKSFHAAAKAQHRGGNLKLLNWLARSARGNRRGGDDGAPKESPARNHSERGGVYYRPCQARCFTSCACWTCDWDVNDGFVEPNVDDDGATAEPAAAASDTDDPRALRPQLAPTTAASG